MSTRWLLHAPTIVSILFKVHINLWILKLGKGVILFLRIHQICRRCLLLRLTEASTWLIRWWIEWLLLGWKLLWHIILVLSRIVVKLRLLVLLLLIYIYNVWHILVWLLIIHWLAATSSIISSRWKSLPWSSSSNVIRCYHRHRIVYHSTNEWCLLSCHRIWNSLSIAITH